MHNQVINPSPVFIQKRIIKTLLFKKHFTVETLHTAATSQKKRISNTLLIKKTLLFEEKKRTSTKTLIENKFDKF